MTGQTAVWVDGVQQSALNLPDRGLSFGDGLFETILLRAGRPLFIDSHLARLRRGLQGLEFPDCSVAASQYVEDISRRSAHLPWAALRLTVTRGAGPRGYAPPGATKPRHIVEVTELERDCCAPGPALDLGLASVFLSRQPALAGFKHLNRLEQVLAAEQLRKQAKEEGVLCDDNHRVVSAVAGNLFLLRDGELRTPALLDCGVAGTRRELLMTKWAPAVGLRVQEVALTVADLQAAEEVFYTNALWGIRPVARFEGANWTEHPVTDALFGVYMEDIQC